MKLLKTRCIGAVLLMGLSASIYAGGFCHRISPPNECWHHCNTKDGITICEILTYPDIPGNDAPDTGASFSSGNNSGPKIGQVKYTVYKGKRIKGVVKKIGKR